MARNVEIKARARNFTRQSHLADRLGDGDPEHLIQEDTFFSVPSGRLKLREFNDGSGELIQYERKDSSGPAESAYVCCPTSEPETLKQALSRTLGVRAVVRKKRTVYHSGRTRIHLDQVVDLGDFIELEVVLEPGEPAAHGVSIVHELMTKLEIEGTDLVEKAYVDLLQEKD